MADYRGFLPAPGQSRIAGPDTDSHSRARLDTPRATEPFRQWGELARQPYRGITTEGTVVTGLYGLRDEGAPVQEMARAATALLEVLTAPERSRGHHDIGSDHWRHWQNTEIHVEQHGLWLEHLNADTREKVLAVLRASLSDQGYDNAIGAMRLNAFLGDLIGAPGVLGQWHYSFCLYGRPSTDAPWGWQLWGHHLALSCLVIGGQMVLTPCFVGAEISHADHGLHAGTTLFQDEERLGLDLFNTLPAAMQTQARLGFDLSGADLPEGLVHFADYLSLGGAYQDNRVVPLEGARAGGFDAPQRTALLNLVDAYVRAMPPGPRAAKMADVERHLAETHFCWIGGHGPDDPFYYRIQSPVIMIEFDHHPGIFLTNAEPQKFHVHTIVRTPNGNDYGIDLLRQHYAHAHGKAGGHRHT